MNTRVRILTALLLVTLAASHAAEIHVQDFGRAEMGMRTFLVDDWITWALILRTLLVTTVTCTCHTNTSVPRRDCLPHPIRSRKCTTPHFRLSLTDVIVQGNLLHNSGPPRYRYAVVVEGEPNAPRGPALCGKRIPSGKRRCIERRTAAMIRGGRGFFQ